MIRFKPITEKDIDFFVETFNEEGNLFWMKQDVDCEPRHVRQIMKIANLIWFIVYYKDGGAWLRVGLFTIKKQDNKVYLGIIVRVTWRRIGLCRKTMMQAFSFLDRKEPITYIKVFSDHYMIDFYKSLGYKPTGLDEEMKGRKLLEFKRNGKKKDN